MDHDAQPTDEGAAKAFVKNPGGAIWRNDRRGRSPIDLARLTREPASVAELSWVSWGGGIAEANGLESQPPGSAGKLSLPATVKLLN